MPLPSKILLSTALVAALGWAEPRSDWNVRDHIPLDRIIVQSHRGGGERMPENSLETFHYAWDLGTVPEADVRTTRDGVLVAFHDNDFRRVLPNATPEQQQQGVKDLTWDEVARIDVGAWRGARFAGQRLPRLSDVFRVMSQAPSRRLYLDIKDADMEQLAQEAKTAGVASLVIVASTHHGLLRRWKDLVPESSTLLWMGGSEELLTKRFADLRQSQFASVTQLQIHVRFNDDEMTPSPEFLLRTGAELRQRNILFQVFPWVTEDPSAFKRLLDLGVASFATDYPEATMKAIREYYKASR